MARRDLFEWLHGPHGEGADPLGHSYRSGFWATLPIPALSALGRLRLRARVRLSGGAELSVPIGEIDIVASRATQPAGLAPGTIAICMATYEPDPTLLRIQIESLRQQTDRRWICVISDGGSSPESFEQIARLVADDGRFLLSRSETRLDPYRNFERVLGLVPADAELLAPCDQDDRWYPEKLEVLRRALGDRALVYCDQRLVTADGSILRDSLWHGRRNDCENLASLLVANTVPGAAMLLRREVAELATPFPTAPGVQYHDHWLALTALASGSIGYVDRPLYDYVQHAGAVQGGVSAPTDVVRRPPGSRGWRSAYFGGYLTRQLQARTLLLRCEPALTRRKRRALIWFAAADRSQLSFAWLAARPLRRLFGRDETLGGEASLAAGLLWRRLIVIAVGRAQLPGRRAFDASFPDPPRFEQRRLRRWRIAREH
jgi:PAS domain-containing protein